MGENIVQCSHCGRRLIAEESCSHQCPKGKKVKSVMVMFDKYYISLDGKTWFRYFPPTKSEQPKETTKDGTNPNITSEWIMPKCYIQVKT